MPSEIELEYYANPGPMTDLSSCPPETFDRLPHDRVALMKVVRRCVADGFGSEDVRGDMQIRPAAAMVSRVLEIDPAPLAERRPRDRRMLGCCRHFATLTCALLRRNRTPARVRAGFAGYFDPSKWVDHWIIEYWSAPQDRWVRVDPQYGDRWFQARDPDATSEGMTALLFLSGGEAWQRCRAGELDPDTFEMGGVNRGIGEIRGSVLLDLAALNQDEVLPWDAWGQMVAAYRSETDASYDELLDSISALVSAGDFHAIREIYDGDDDVRVPTSVVGV